MKVFDHFGQVLHKIILGGILLILLSVPIFFSRFSDLLFLPLPSLYTDIVFAVPKAVLFMILVDILSILWIIKTIFIEKKGSWIIPSVGMLRILGGILLSWGLSTIFSDVPLVSFWGAYEKQQGLWMMLHYLIYLFLFLSTIKKEHLSLVFKTIVASAFLTSLYAVLQGIGWDPITIWAGEALKGRVFSTLGHPNYLGYFLVFTLPITLYETYLSFQKNNIATKLCTGISLLFQVFALYLSGSRSAIIGIVGGVFFALFIFLFLSTSRKTKKNIGLILGGVLLLGVLLSILVPSFSSALRFDSANMRSVQSRLVVWQDTLKMIAKKPLLGYGLDTYALYFPEVKSKELLDLENYNQNADRAHNIILDTLQSVGGLGTVLYLALWGVLITTSIKLITRKEKRKEGILFTSILVGYFFALLWGFSVVTHDIYFFTIIALLCLITQEEKTYSIRGWQKIVGIIIILPLILSLMGSLQLYAADHFAYEGKIKNDNSLLVAGADTAPQEYAYKIPLLSLSAQYPTRLFQEIDEILHHRDYQVELIRAVWLIKNGQLDEARQILEQLEHQYPFIPPIYLMRGQMEKEAGNADACIASYEQLLSFSPAYWQYDSTIQEKDKNTQDRYRLFFKENPGFRAIFTDLTLCALDKNDTTTALQYAPHIEESVIKDALLARIYKNKGQLSEAQKYFEKCKTWEDNKLCDDIYHAAP
jgi:O-antigen ligase